MTSHCLRTTSHWSSSCRFAKHSHRSANALLQNISATLRMINDHAALELTVSFLAYSVAYMQYERRSLTEATFSSTILKNSIWLAVSRLHTAPSMLNELKGIQYIVTIHIRHISLVPAQVLSPSQRRPTQSALDPVHGDLKRSRVANLLMGFCAIWHLAIHVHSGQILAL